jgi:hypothetical protein
MTRRLYNVLSTISLLTFVATLYPILGHPYWHIIWGHQHQRILCVSSEFIDFERNDPPADWQIDVSWICAVSMILPGVRGATWVREYRQERGRKKKGLCERCGYDLRATTARCPECGTMAKSRSPIDVCEQR